MSRCWGVTSDFMLGYGWTLGGYGDSDDVAFTYNGTAWDSGSASKTWSS